MRRFPIFLGCIALLAVAAGEVHADSVELTSVGPADVVTLQFPGVYSGPVYAGLLNWSTVPAPSGADPNPSPGAPFFSTFCIDILSDINLDIPYSNYCTSSLALTEADGTVINRTQAIEIEYLWGSHFGSIANPLNGTTSQDNAAALQIDIWKIIYGSGLTVTPYPYPGSTCGWQSIAPGWLSTPGNTFQSLVALASPKYQDQTMLAPPGTVDSFLETVPTPSSLAGSIVLFALILGGLAFRKSFVK